MISAIPAKICLGQVLQRLCARVCQQTPGDTAVDYRFEKQPDGSTVLRIGLSDYALMLHPLLNKGMAFTARERELFNLWGLLPPSEISLAIQRTRSAETCQAKRSDMEKYIYLRDLQDSNETLFYSLLGAHLDELMPIIYTPVVGMGCQHYSHIYRRPRGVFVSWPNRNHMDRILANMRFDHVKLIVVSDGERILGLGDQGAGGMGIPIGKLALYTACGGVHPGMTLPVLLDTGTDNPVLQKDPLYIGWQHPRIRGQAYDDFIDLFVQAVKKRFRNVLLHWEDFSRENAGRILDRYREQLCTFNDDIQGTAAAVLGSLLSATHVTGRRLSEQKVVIVGAGSAGCGIARFVSLAMQAEGLSPAAALSHIYLVDREGLLTQGQSLLHFQRPFARSDMDILPLMDVVKQTGAGVLIGVSGQGGAFTEPVIRMMAASVARPVIFPLSNPDTHSEARPADLLAWTEGRAVISTGSPFPPVCFAGETRRVDQTNNAYIFPGLGLALLTLQASRVTDAMLMTAARALAGCSPAKDNPRASLLPPLRTLRAVSLKVALAVAQEILGAGFAQTPGPADLEACLAEAMWTPVYVPYEKESSA